MLEYVKKLVCNRRFRVVLGFFIISSFVHRFFCREAKSTVIKAHGGAVRTIGFSHDGQFLLTGSDDKTIKVHLLFILFASQA
jgi:WD40 repeat protein